MPRSYALGCADCGIYIAGWRDQYHIHYGLAHRPRDRLLRGQKVMLDFDLAVLNLRYQSGASRWGGRRYRHLPWPSRA